MTDRDIARKMSDLVAIYQERERCAREVAVAMSDAYTAVRDGRMADPLTPQPPPLSAWQESLIDRRTALYRAYDHEDRLLYVGITTDVDVRLGEHRREAPWFAAMARLDVEWFPDRLGAEGAEREAIRTEHPMWNIVHGAARRDRP
jgi:hypothetical protein